MQNIKKFLMGLFILGLAVLGSQVANASSSYMTISPTRWTTMGLSTGDFYIQWNNSDTFSDAHTSGDNGNSVQANIGTGYYVVLHHGSNYYSACQTEGYSACFASASSGDKVEQGSYNSTTSTVSPINQPVNGSCNTTHYNCITGTTGSNVNGRTSYTWRCVGANGGSTASCSQNKSGAVRGISILGGTAPSLPSTPANGTNFVSGTANALGATNSGILPEVAVVVGILLTMVYVSKFVSMGREVGKK